MLEPRAVILAAGESRRMGRPKLLLELNGKPLLQYAVEAARAWDPIVVTGLQIAASPWLLESGAAITINEEAGRGMAHSLGLAHEATDPQRPFLVLLGDKPFVTTELVVRVCQAASGVDVCYPARAGEPGHPVYFSANARARIPSLPQTGGICGLRDDPSLRRSTFECDDDGAFFDVDTPDDIERAIARQAAGAVFGSG
jgi:CTP:molybdopterin cytidylyltransferase MocA